MGREKSGPPGLITSSEVGLGPLAYEHVVVLHADVGQGQRERGRATNHLAGGVVLTAMARAHELVGTTVPGNDATEVGADGVDAVAADGVLAFDDQIGGITLEALYKAAIAFGVTGEPTAGCDGIAQLIFGTGSTAAAGGLGGNEVVRHRIKGSQGDTSDGAECQQIHELPTTHSGHIARGKLGHGGRSSSSDCPC